MGEVSMIGLDIAKSVFQAHGADGRGEVVFRRKIARAKVLAFFAGQPRCVVVMEACGGAHHWGRELGKLGHEVKLIAPKYVKPFLKRQKNDAADAEAICEAASRPAMRFVSVKSEEKQAAALVFRARDLLVRQRTQLVNAVRGHMAEYGWIAPQGAASFRKLAGGVEDPACPLPETVRAVLIGLIETVRSLEARIAGLDAVINRRARADATARRLMTVPGIGPVTATAIAALAPPPETFRRGRDFAAWTGLTPLQHATGGKQKLGATSKMGERTIRRLLTIGAAGLVRQAVKRGAPHGSWLARMLARKPRQLVIVAQANRMARTAWALMAKGEDYRAPAPQAA
jgi:transposase